MAQHPMRAAAERADVKQRLADAAPDLLAALKLCLPIMEYEFGTYGPRTPETRAIALARAAIARAEGAETNQGKDAP
jgi:hypothetical protein